MDPLTIAALGTAGNLVGGYFDRQSAEDIARADRRSREKMLGMQIQEGQTVPFQS